MAGLDDESMMADIAALRVRRATTAMRDAIVLHALERVPTLADAVGTCTCVA